MICLILPLGEWLYELERHGYNSVGFVRIFAPFTLALVSLPHLLVFIRFPTY